MARSRATAEFTSFINGLITEASPLDFPENSSFDEENFVLKRDGSRQRRLGLDYESNYALTTTSLANAQVQSGLAPIGIYRWDNVNNDPSLSFGVVQVSDDFYFMDLGTSNPSANLKNGGSPVNVSTTSGEKRASFASIGGDLLIATGNQSIIRLSYDEGTDTMISESFIPLVRDIWGVDDTDVAANVDTRPTVDDPEHKYNTSNQGWYKDDVYCKGVGEDNPYDHMFTETGEYPSNADIWWVARDSQSAGTDFNSFDPDRFSYVAAGNTSAPKGHYVIDPFSRSSSRQSASGITTGDTDADQGGFYSMASFAGRIFYSGISLTSVERIATSPRLESAVIFTQTVKDNSYLSKCYQEQDPTAEDGGELVDTDGGIIFINDASSISRLVAVGSQLFVFAENGVWGIRGSDSSFSATNYQVDRISNVGAINAQSIVEVENTVFFWADSGIYLLSPDKVTGQFTPTNITERSISTLYLEDIPSPGKLYATGTFDLSARQVKWLYNDDSSYDGDENVFRYNKELIYDLTTGGWTKHSFPAGVAGPFVAAPLITPDFVLASTVSPVVDGADTVVDGADTVVLTDEVRSRGVTFTKYLVIVPGTTFIDFTLAAYRRDDFLDWYISDSTGTDAAAFIEAGYIVGGDTQRDKSIKSLTTHFKRTETGYVLDGNGNIALDNASGCQARVKWGFTDSSNSGRWSTPFQAYRLNRLYLPEDVNDPFDYGYDIITTKSKVRGKGRSIRVRFESEAGKDLFIYGWAMTFSQESAADG